MKRVGCVNILVAILWVGGSAQAAEAQTQVRGITECLLGVVRNAVVLAGPRVGLPSGSGKGFNLRVVGMTGRKAPFDAQDLYRRSMRMANAQLSKLESYGFKPTSKIEFVVEAHPGAVAVKNTETGTDVAVSKECGHAFMSGDGSDLRLPAWIGRSDWTRSVGQKAAENPTVFIGAVNQRQHVLDFPEVIAHELAHATEPRLAISLTWREARADFLAYLATGATQIKMPAQAMGRKPATSAGNDVLVLRDIARPRVQTSEQVRTRLNGYHQNSTLVSNLLYEMSQRFGKETVAGFVRWVDSLPAEQQAPLLLSVADRPKSGPIPIGIQFVDESNPEGVNRAILGDLHHLGMLFRHWAHDVQSLDREGRVWLDRELATRGVLRYP